MALDEGPEGSVREKGCPLEGTFVPHDLPAAWDKTTFQEKVARPHPSESSISSMLIGSSCFERARISVAMMDRVSYRLCLPRDTSRSCSDWAVTQTTVLSRSSSIGRWTSSSLALFSSFYQLSSWIECAFQGKSKISYDHPILWPPSSG